VPTPKQDREATKILRAERRRKALALSVAGRTYDQIVALSKAEGWPLGYNSRQAVHRDLRAALDQAIKEQNVEANRLIAKELLRLEGAVATITEIMEKDHLAHSNGKVVTYVNESGEIVRVYDDGPRLAASQALIRASESIRRLTGLDAPAKVAGTVDGTINYVINATPDELEQL
jgi:hypothetical protein